MESSVREAVQVNPFLLGLEGVARAERTPLMPASPAPSVTVVVGPRNVQAKTLSRTRPPKASRTPLAKTEGEVAAGQRTGSVRAVAIGPKTEPGSLHPRPAKRLSRRWAVPHSQMRDQPRSAPAAGPDPQQEGSDRGDLSPTGTNGRQSRPPRTLPPARRTAPHTGEEFTALRGGAVPRQVTETPSPPQPVAQTGPPSRATLLPEPDPRPGELAAAPQMPEGGTLTDRTHR